MLSQDKLRDQLTERRGQLEAGIRQLEAQLAANRGALQMCDEALAMLDGEEPEPDAEV